MPCCLRMGGDIISSGDGLKAYLKTYLKNVFFSYSEISKWRKRELLDFFLNRVGGKRVFEISNEISRMTAQKIDNK